MSHRVVPTISGLAAELSTVSQHKGRFFFLSLQSVHRVENEKFFFSIVFQQEKDLYEDNCQIIGSILTRPLAIENLEEGIFLLTPSTFSCGSHGNTINHAATRENHLVVSHGGEISFTIAFTQPSDEVIWR